MGDEALRQTAFRMMLTIVNEWHRQVGIDEVMKTKLTRAIADTVATGVIEKTLGEALRSVREEERERSSGLVTALQGLRSSIHACNRNPIPNSKRVEWRDRIDAMLEAAIASPSERAGDGDR